MSTGASRRAAAQMERDGIKTIPSWSKPKRNGCASYQTRIVKPACDEQGCLKKAGYSTPIGNCCFEHAIALATPDPSR